MLCPCGTDVEYNSCCEPIINGSKRAKTAEALMRSRYTAYVVKNIDHIKNTLAPHERDDFDYQASKKWAEESEWLGLEVHESEKGGPQDRSGTVDFTATYKEDGEVRKHREHSFFKRGNDGHWYFVEGEILNRENTTVVHDQPKLGRNDPCLCGSGKKYKKCCAL
tara:strand:+ start:16275 stop:16769 length:495 start_codon:yes stop_codon:yes gene_type:complete